MPSAFCFTHPPHFLHFFPLTYGTVVVIDFDLLIVLFSLFARLLVWLSADRLLSAPSDLSQFVLLLLLFLFMLFLMPCAWKSFYFSPRLLSVCLLMHCWVPPLRLCCCCYCFCYYFLAQSLCCDFLCCYWCHVLEMVLFFPWMLSGCLLMDCWVPRLSPLPGLKTQMHNVSIQRSTLKIEHNVSMQFNNNCWKIA